MQYFLQRLLNLEPEEDTEAVITSLERGNLIHRVLYLFYTQLTIDERKTPWEFSDRLENIATQDFKSLPYDDIVWIIEKEKYFGNPSRPGLWEKFLQLEKEYLQHTGFIPSYFESEFGYQKRKGPENFGSTSLTIKHLDKNIKIYGKIDRIDLDEHDRFIVIDYKSGQGAMKIKVADMWDGLSLQLPVYIAGAKSVLHGRSKEAVPVAGMYYQVQDADNCQTKFILTNQDADTDHLESFNPEKSGRKKSLKNTLVSFPELVENTLTHITDYIDLMSKGNFQHTKSPKDPKCTSYCSFRRICRKDTGKLLSLQE
jgi:ATP-dependent helicase/DNAse subunit B